MGEYIPEYTGRFAGDFRYTPDYQGQETEEEFAARLSAQELAEEVRTLARVAASLLNPLSF